VKIRNIKTPSDWQRLEYHPFSELTEFGLGIDTEAVIDHMVQNGWDPSERITLYEGKILDGRHKHSCAQKAEVAPRFQEFDGPDVEALEFVRKKLLRQHLDTGQRAMIAAKLATLKEGRPKNAGKTSAEKEETPSSDGVSGATRDDAAEQMNVSTKSVDRAKVIQKRGSAKLQRAVAKGQVTITDAAIAALWPKKVQDAALAKLAAGEIRTLVAAAPPGCDEHGRPIKTGKGKRKKARRATVQDQLGAAVPEGCRDAFADPSLRNLVIELEQVAGMLTAESWLSMATKLVGHYPFLLIDKFKDHAYEALHRLQLAAEALRAGVPHAVCPTCQGKPGEGATCRTCRGGGYVPEWRYKEVVE
jgi:hypothetical protein